MMRKNRLELFRSKRGKWVALNSHESMNSLLFTLCGHEGCYFDGVISTPAAGLRFGRC